MPFKFDKFDCSPLVIDDEYSITDEGKLAEYVGEVVLGYFAHVKRIINELEVSGSKVGENEIDLAIAKVNSSGKNDVEIYKRDGWLFQIISWLALLVENKGKSFYCQQPHDAPAQHGIDGVAIILSTEFLIEQLIITEDKCTTNHRDRIAEIWEEFREFEKGSNNNKLVSRISALIEHLNDGKVLEANQNNIYNNNLRKYRVGLNRKDGHQSSNGRKKLFKDYDNCVTGDDPHRRFASTVHQNGIRNWMEQFSLKVIAYLNTKRKPNV
jgi:hypothetical protein